jgi:hypothetical protein
MSHVMSMLFVMWQQWFVKVEQSPLLFCFVDNKYLDSYVKGEEENTPEISSSKTKLARTRLTSSPLQTGSCSFSDMLEYSHVEQYFGRCHAG